MSIKLMCLAWDLDLPLIKKMIMLKLADNASDEGECFPSYQHIADKCGTSRRTVMRHVSELEAMGLVSKNYRTARNGKNSSNIFKLHLEGDLGKIVSEEHHHSDSQTSSDSVCRSPRTSHSIEPVNEPKDICANSICYSLDGNHQTQTKDLIQSAFDVFWAAGMRKVGKPASLNAFKSALKKNKRDPMQFAHELANDIKQRNEYQQFGFDKLHPERYLKHERWTDELVDNRMENTYVQGIQQPQVDHIPDQSKYPEQIRLCASDSVAVRGSKLAFQREYDEDPWQ